MNRDDIIRWAREAGIPMDVQHPGWLLPHLARLADLVAAAEREACEQEINTWRDIHDAVVKDSDKTAAELRRLHSLNAELVDALERISYVKPDQLDHAIDVSIIERCAVLARAALAKAESKQ